MLQSLQHISLSLDIPEAEGSKRTFSSSCPEGSKTHLFARGLCHTRCATAALSGWVFAQRSTQDALLKHLGTFSNAEHDWLCIELYFTDWNIKDTDFDLWVAMQLREKEEELPCSIIACSPKGSWDPSPSKKYWADCGCYFWGVDSCWHGSWMLIQC